MQGRNGQAIQGIVDHHSASTLAGLIARFTTAPSVSGGGASAHFAIDRDGTRYQIVDTADTAFHAADFNANLTTVGIEHVRLWGSGPGTAGFEPITDEQYASSHELHLILARDNGFPLDLDHVRPHNFYTNTTCPGDLDIARIIAPVPAQRRLPEMLFPRDPATGVIYAYDPLAKTARALTSIEWAACEAAGAQSGDMKNADAVALLKGLPAPSTGGGSGGGAKPTKLTGTITGELS